MPNDAIAIAGDPQPLVLERPDAFADDYVLSPYVVRRDNDYEMLVRLVNRDDDAAKKISRVHHARSRDGLAFAVAATAEIAPGAPGTDDDLGCEDPTVGRDANDFVVYYSGYGGPQKISSMLGARGSSLTQCRKFGRVFPDQRYANPKEAALLRTSGGVRLFFEYATGGASRIGVADAPSFEGPWVYADSPLGERTDRFDSWHLSPACATRLHDGRHVLWYNGATHKTDWRIGWALLSDDGRTVLERCEEPLVATFDLEPGDTDIAFAASAVVEAPGSVSLYYSISDRRLLRHRLRVDGAIGDSAMVDTA